MSVRQEKISSVLKKEIAAIILVEGYEGVKGLVTITAAEVTGDLEQAKIFVSAVGQDVKEVVRILNMHIYEIQGYINKKLKMRKAPRISFFPDTSGEYASHIAKVIGNLREP